MKKNHACYFVIFLQLSIAFQCFSQTWEWVNPLPQGNTLNAVKFIEPGHAVAVGDAATVMRTTDSGETWDITYKVTGLTSSLRGLSFYGQKGIAVSDSGTVITTDDGGLTWTKLESGTDVNLLSAFMFNDTIAFAVGWDGAIIRTLDGGASWQLQAFQITEDLHEDLYAVTFVDSFGMAVGSWGRVSLTYDLGETWTHLLYPGLPELRDVFFLNRDSGFILPLGGGILRTINGGENWTLYTLDTQGSLFDMDFYDGARGIIAGTFGLFTSADSGKTWSQPPGGVLDGHRSLRALDLADDESGLAVGTSGTMLTKSQVTEKWIQRSLGLTESLHDLAFLNADTGIATSSSNLVYTFDGGKTWAPLTDAVMCCLSAIDFFDENRGTVVGSFNQILRTDDGSKTWQKQDTPFLYSHTFQDVFHVTRDTAFVVGESGIILSTTNGGDKWVEQESGLDPNDSILNAVFFTDTRHGVVVGEGGEILRTTDGGQAWSIVGISNEPLTDVCFINHDIGVIVGDDGLILRTINGGLSWFQVNEGANWLYSVDFVNARTGFAVGQRGTILRTDDGGLTWSPELTNTTEWLHKIVIKDASSIFAVGSRGAILKRAGGIVSVRDASEEKEIKPSVLLLQNYPNPFNISTTVSLYIPSAGVAAIKLFDVTGKQVGTVFSGRISEGHHIVNWHADDLASGVYFLQAEFNELHTPHKMTAIHKMLLIK